MDLSKLVQEVTAKRRMGRSLSMAVNKTDNWSKWSNLFLDIKIDLNSIPCSWI
jgi:hypothetical protein